MTRKDDLLKVARIAVNTFQNDIDGPFVLPSGHKDVLIQRIHGVLLQVEREVLSRIEDQIRTNAFIRGNDQYKERTALNEMADWCKEQKETL